MTQEVGWDGAGRVMTRRKNWDLLGDWESEMEGRVGRKGGRMEWNPVRRERNG